MERGRDRRRAACKTQVDRRLIHHLDLGRVRWRDLIGSVERPTLLVVPRGDGGGVRTANPVVTIARIPGVGHCIRRDDPAAYFGVVDPFLSAAGTLAPGVLRASDTFRHQVPDNVRC